MSTITEKIKNDTRRLLTEWKQANMAKILKFYEILIELQKTRIPKNKREIFYTSVNIFKCQKTIDILIRRTTKLFNVTQIELYISSSLKGLYFGNVKFTINDKVVTDTLLIPDMTYVENIEYNCSKVLVIEKDSIFSLITKSIIDDKQFSDVLFVCGKGYPCHNTLRFLEKLPKNVSVYGLFDYDPYGLHIYSTIKYGTKNTEIRIEQMIHIGLKHQDLFDYKIDTKDLIEMKANDYNMIERLVGKYDCLRDELLFLKGMGKKMELEILTTKNPGFLTDYLIKKMCL